MAGLRPGPIWLHRVGAAVVTAASLAGSADELAPRREVGAERHLRFGTVLSIHAQTARMTGEADGEPLDQELELDEETLRVATALVTERIVASADGREELERTVHEAHHRAEVTRSGLPEKIPNAHSPLQGRTVRFTTAERGALVARFADEGEADECLLKELAPESEPLPLLPEGEVSPGDSWSLDEVDLGFLVRPAGNLFPCPEEEPGQAGPAREFLEIALATSLAGTEATADELLADLTGSVQATYKGSRDLEGLRVVEIALEFDGRSSFDPTDRFRRVIEGGIDEDIPFDYAHEVLTVLDGRGTLLWNLADGRLENLSWEADVALEERIYLATAFVDPRTEEERTLDTTILVEWHGTVSYEARDEPGP